MRILDHLEELRVRAFRALWVLMIFFVFFFTFSIRFGEVGGVPLPYPWPDIFDAVSIWVLRGMLEIYLPEGVQAVQLTPAEGILVQMKISLFMAFVFAMPVIVHEAAKFVAPGLYPHERKVILKITVPATLLFLGGILTAHFFIVPFMFEFLYGIGIAMGLTPLAGPDQIFGIVLLLFVGMGLAFQTPVAMWGLTALGVVDPEIWKKYWRIAIVGIFVFGAVITPDGSGVTMLLVAVPMTLLYGVGYLVAVRHWRRTRGGPEVGKERDWSRVVAWSLAAVLVAAVAGGFVYAGMPLLQPPVRMTEHVVAAGTLEVDLPAFVLFAPNRLAEDMRSGATLRAANATTLTFAWSATASDGTPVLFATPEDEEAALLEVRPAQWPTGASRSLTLTVVDGETGVYVLRATLRYDLVLRTTFQDVDRSGVLDEGDVLLDRSMVFRHAVVPESAFLRDAAAVGIAPPAEEDRLLLDQGLFHALGSGWQLQASLREFMEENGTFAHAAPVALLEVEELTVRLTLTRTFTWSPDEDLWVWVQGQSSAEFVYNWYLDRRFGALYPVLEPA